WALPADTFRSTVHGMGKGATRFRPSRRTTIANRQRLLTAADVAAARQLAVGDLRPDSRLISGLPEDRRRRVLALASEYLLYLNSKSDGLSSADNRRFIDILRVRSQLQGIALEPDPPASPGPLASHGTSRLESSLGGDDGLYIGLGYRPALHDILDPWKGYQQGAQIQLFEPKIRFYPEDNRLELQALTLVDILSIPQHNRLLTPISWRALLDGRRVYYPKGRKLTGEGTVGFGLSLPLDSRISGYGLLGASVLLNDYFPGFVNGGPSLACGIAANLSPSWNVLLHGDLAYYALGDQRWVSHLTFGQDYSLDNRNGFRLNLSYTEEFTDPNFAFSFSWLHYF
ncbi:MAG: DUF7840 domain-containing protein, partial [Desulforhopalus sp.]